MSWLSDVRFAFRSLVKRPAFALVAIATLGLGSGLNTAMFSVLNVAVLRPLPYPDPDRIVRVYGREWQGVSEPDLRDVAKAASSLEAISAFTGQTVNLTGRERPDRVRGGFVSASFFDVLKVGAAKGRVFWPDEDQAGAERVALVNHAAWTSRFGADPALLGSRLTLNGDPYTVVGILPETFRFEWDEVEVWLPLHTYPNSAPENRGARGLGALARLRPGVPIEAARAELRAVAARLEQAHPDTNKGYVLAAQSFDELRLENRKTQMLTLLGVVGAVLLLACANVANLLLARGAARGRELALRAALGASRAGLARLLLAEALLLATAGALLAFGVAAAASRPLAALTQVRSGSESLLDPVVLGFSVALTGLVTLLVGAAPALQLTRGDAGTALKQGERGSSDGPRGERLRSGFVVSQIAVALALTVSTGLLVRSLGAVLERQPGFDPANLLTMEYRLPRNAYPDGASQWRFHSAVAERAAAVPGVLDATVVRGLPFSGNGGSVRFTLPGRLEAPEQEAPSAQENAVAPNFFQTMRIPLQRGRGFDARDTKDAPPVVVINKTMADTLFAGAEPIGASVRLIGPNITATIVGVVGDVRQFSLEEQLRPQIYTAYAQNPHIFATLVARTRPLPMTLAEPVSAAVWSVDKDQPVWKVRSLESLLEGSTAPRRSLLGLLSGFTLLALLLSALGLYGVMTHAVQQRSREFGVRLALGAGRELILRLVLGRGLRLAALGVLLGSGLALATTRLLRTLLFGVTPADPVAFAVAASLLPLVALAASLLPAWRATRVDPMSALRSE